MSDQEKPKEQEVYTKDFVEKILKEKKNAMQALEEFKLKIDAYDNKLKEKEIEVLKVGENWQTVASQREKELLEAKEILAKKEAQISNMVTQQVNGHKLSALKRELDKLGIEQKSVDFALKNADLNSMKYDDEHKVVLGVEEVAKSIKDAAPGLFGASVPGVNHGAPASNNAKLDLETYKKMDIKDRRKISMADLYKAQGIELKD